MIVVSHVIQCLLNLLTIIACRIRVKGFVVGTVKSQQNICLFNIYMYLYFNPILIRKPLKMYPVYLFWLFYRQYLEISASIKILKVSFLKEKPNTLKREISQNDCQKFGLAAI